MTPIRILLASLTAVVSVSTFTAEPAEAARVSPALESPVLVTDALTNQQPARIDAAVAKIAAAALPGPQVYFVGFAGFGEERVFAEEIDLAQKRVAERYGSGERSLLLINDRRDIETFPLATAAALRYALEGLAKIMDADDVLFLALSSHGWKDASISVSNPGMQPSALRAAPLAEMLRESGIRWKVIVISACYSGSFVKALADNHTIVITAAAKNRASFGCSDDRHLTYFGEAFYRDALPHASTLRAAFEATRREIARREREEKVRPSQPQSYFGPMMESKLAEMEAARTGAAPAETQGR